METQPRTNPPAAPPADRPIHPVLVTGDAGPDFDIHLDFDGPNPPPGAKPTVVQQSLGGAGLVHRVLEAWAGRGDGSGARIAADLVPESAPTFAVWKPMVPGAAIANAKPNTRIWRTDRTTNPGETTGFTAPAPAVPAPPPPGFAPGVILVIDDASKLRHPHGARRAVEDFWAPAYGPGPWLVWKMAPPLCRGEMWWKAVASGAAARSVVLVSADHLRREPVRVSRRISWERTACDIARELASNPTMAELRTAAHVVVTLHGEGALWMRRTGEDSAFTLVFDPAHMEREWWPGTSGQGGAYGYGCTFAACLAAHLADEAPSGDPGGVAGAIGKAIPKGLLAMRALHALGRGVTDAPGSPAFPAAIIGAVIREGADPLESAGLDPTKFGGFAAVGVPREAMHGASSSWQISRGGGERGCGGPLRGLARRVALFGERELRQIPHARFRKLLTADRDEIEALRNLRSQIEDYRHSKKTKPLSLAVFGPPGAGKSFGVKQIADEILGGEGQVLEFNLSQFSETDLAGAFHQVRDTVLRGKMPVVFWDEFDSCEYKWLRLLLAPMNDGVFQEGQITHPLGRCIFVFAGGTSSAMRHFGPPEPGERATEAAREAWEAFKRCKGPDFVSRVHGSLDVLGPNRRPLAKDLPEGGRAWDEDAGDVCFPLRRAIVLRGILGLKANQRLHIDHGLLTALLEVGRYTNGTRSFEKILVSMNDARLPDDVAFVPSHLPPDAILEMNIANSKGGVSGVEEFRALMGREAAFENIAHTLARSIHENFRATAKLPDDHPNNRPFEALNPETVMDNIAAARRIPWLLGLVGLYITDGKAPGVEPLSRDQVLEILREPATLEMLAEEEHDQWVALKRANGWIPGARDDSRHVHHLLISYANLPEEQRKKDRCNVLGIPDQVIIAGFAIVSRGTGGTP